MSHMKPKNMLMLHLSLWWPKVCRSAPNVFWSNPRFYSRFSVFSLLGVWFVFCSSWTWSILFTHFAILVPYGHHQEPQSALCSSSLNNLTRLAYVRSEKISSGQKIMEGGNEQTCNFWPTIINSPASHSWSTRGSGRSVTRMLVTYFREGKQILKWSINAKINAPRSHKRAKPP